jgi:hypothetical protein
MRRTPVLAALEEHRPSDGLTEAVDLEQERSQGLIDDRRGAGQWSNERLLVELRGLDPLTFSLRRHRVRLAWCEHREIVT